MLFLDFNKELGICGLEDLIGHVDVVTIETPLNDTMKEKTPTFDELRKRFNITSGAVYSMFY